MGYRITLARLAASLALLAAPALVLSVCVTPQAHAQIALPGDAAEQPDPYDEDAEWPDDEPGDWSEPGDEREPEPAPLPPTVTTSTVAGKVAMMRTDGKAAIPRGAPKRVRALIRHANKIVGKPYKWGGGHRRLDDRGYDCSGAVSFALIKGKMLRSVLVSGGFKRWGAAGAGRYISVYARASHVYLEVAGLRLDTSPVGDRTAGKGVRWRPVIGRRAGFTARHPVGL